MPGRRNERLTILVELSPHLTDVLDDDGFRARVSDGDDDPLGICLGTDVSHDLAEVDMKVRVLLEVESDAQTESEVPTHVDDTNPIQVPADYSRLNWIHGKCPG